MVAAFLWIVLIFRMACQNCLDILAFLRLPRRLSRFMLHSVYQCLQAFRLHRREFVLHVGTHLACVVARCRILTTEEPERIAGTRLLLPLSHLIVVTSRLFAIVVAASKCAMPLAKAFVNYHQYCPFHH